MTLEQLKEICQNGDESPNVDFKRDQYHFDVTEVPTHQRRPRPGNAELIKDIMAFANSNLDTPAYIIIGVREGGAGSHEIVGIDGDKLVDDAELQNKVKGKTNIPLSFTSYAIRNASRDGKPAQIIEISPNKEGKLYYLTETMDHVHPKVIYRRKGTTTEMISPEEIIKEAKDRWRKLQCPTVKIAWESPNLSTKMADELIVLDLREVKRPPKPKPAPIPIDRTFDKLGEKMRILSSLRMPIVPIDASLLSMPVSGPSEEESVKSVVSLFASIRLSVSVSLDGNFMCAAKNACLIPGIEGKGLQIIPNYEFGDFELPGAPPNPCLKRTFRSIAVFRDIYNYTIQPGTVRHADVFIEAKENAEGVLTLAVSADNADLQECRYPICISKHCVELYRSSLLVIAKTLTSLESYDKWIAFFRNHLGTVTFSDPEWRDGSVKDFARQEFGYEHKSKD